MLREPYETTDGRIVRMWVRLIVSGAAWYSGIDVVDYAPPRPLVEHIGGEAAARVGPT